ncbi:hypothetical protein Emag_006967 [Eimeria magna]
MFADVAPPAEEYQKVEYTEYKNAQVMSPPDMPDYMLDYTIMKAKDLLESEIGSDAHAVAVALKRDMDEKWEPCW